MRILGAVLAGGEARRFGSDKALAMFAGKPLIGHAIGALAGRVARIVVCGRAFPGAEMLRDHPGNGYGPMAGINAAVRFAAAQGFDGVLTIGCDTPIVAPEVWTRLRGCPSGAFAESVPVIGYWPSACAATLDAVLAADEKWSVRRCAIACGLVATDCGPIANINFQEDLIGLAAIHG